MPYVSGTATTIADLIAAITGACTANGWTLSGSVIYKGGCYTSLVDSGTFIGVQGGTGISGTDLTGAGPAQISFGAPLTGEPLTFPLPYEVFVSDTEVYCSINWAVTAFTHLGFGCSPAPGLPGTGGWYTASCGGGPVPVFFWNSVNFWCSGVAVDGDDHNATGFFWVPANATAGNAFAHHGLDGGAWSAAADDNIDESGPSLHCTGTAGPKMFRQPNLWNGESSLIPVEPYVDRGSQKITKVIELKNARFVNIANLNPQQIVDLAPDHWKVYPFYRKGTAVRPSDTDTGWLGVAFRYDGP